MAATTVFAYLALPALVYLVFSGIDGRGVADAMRYFLPNYLFFAAPQLVWVVVAALFHARPQIAHVGLAAATIAFVSTVVAFECCINNSNGLGWLFYWPFAATVVVVTVAIAFLLRKRGAADQRHET